MKIAISASGNKLESTIDERFGRCPYFIIVENATEEYGSAQAAAGQGFRQPGMGRGGGRGMGGGGGRGLGGGRGMGGGGRCRNTHRIRSPGTKNPAR